jgi:hypothetical protein
VSKRATQHAELRRADARLAFARKSSAKKFSLKAGFDVENVLQDF